MDFRKHIAGRLAESAELKEKMLRSRELTECINQAALLILDSYRELHGRVFFAGNGGSAADAQHFAAELTGRFQRERRALNAEALTVNTSTMTSISNDYGYEYIFERALEGSGRAGDVFVGLSTSGYSPNIINALRQCRKMDIRTIGFSGEKAGEMNELCDVMIKIPSARTPRIQEGHLLAGHILCEIVEREMFPDV